MNLTIDMETRSQADLKKVGAWRYAEDPTTEIMCLAVKYEECDPVLWIPDKFWELLGEDARVDLLDDRIDKGTISDFIRAATCIEAHNAEFEKALWKHKMVPLGFPPLDHDKVYCSMAKASMHGFPKSLEKACEALGVERKKNMKGHTVMLQTCKPRQPRNAEKATMKPGDIFWFEDSERLSILFNYCMDDAEAEHSLSSALNDLPFSERQIYLMDQEMNERGMSVDTKTSKIILEAVDREREELQEAVEEMMPDIKLTQTAKVLEWINDHLDYPDQLPNLQKATLAKALKNENLPDVVKKVIEARTVSSKASVNKYTTFLSSACSDGKTKGYLVYHGASTGRWAGKLIQPQNLLRPELEQEEIEDAISLFHSGDLNGIREKYKSVIRAAGSCVRAMLVASEGMDLIAADYSSIEARILPWLSGQDDLLQFFKAYDSGNVEYDQYMKAAAAIYNCKAEEVDDDQRFIGKIATLACGYGGGHKAYEKMAASYGVDIDIFEATRIVKLWREDHNSIVNYWYDLEDIIRAAIKYPGKVFPLGRIKMKVADDFLMIKLPSDRKLYYYKPALVKNANPRWEDTITYLGIDTYTKQWGRQEMYGGRAAENVTSAIARDIMVEGMFKARNAGYEPVLTVHDEIVTEIAEGKGSLDEFAELITTNPKWALGIPLAADGWRGKRYRK